MSIRVPDVNQCFLIVGLCSRTNAFLDMHVDSADTNNVYVATNSADVMHATCIGNRTNPLTYKPAEISESLSFNRSDIAMPKSDSLLIVIEYCRRMRQFDMHRRLSLRSIVLLGEAFFFHYKFNLEILFYSHHHRCDFRDCIRSAVTTERFGFIS